MPRGFSIAGPAIAVMGILSLGASYLFSQLASTQIDVGQRDLYNQYSTLCLWLFIGAFVIVILFYAGETVRVRRG